MNPLKIYTSCLWIILYTHTILGGVINNETECDIDVTIGNINYNPTQINIENNIKSKVSLISSDSVDNNTTELINGLDSDKSSASSNVIRSGDRIYLKTMWGDQYNGFIGTVTRPGIFTTNNYYHAGGFHITDDAVSLFTIDNGNDGSIIQNGDIIRLMSSIYITTFFGDIRHHQLVYFSADDEYIEANKDVIENEELWQIELETNHLVNPEPKPIKYGDKIQLFSQRYKGGSCSTRDSYRICKGSAICRNKGIQKRCIWLQNKENPDKEFVGKDTVFKILYGDW